MDEGGCVLVTCPNKCGEDNILKKDLQHHLSQVCSKREFECPDFQKKDVYRVITGPHQDVCERKKVKCECVLERRLVRDHVAQYCDYTEECCKHASLGCEEKMIHRDIKEHEEDQGDTCL